MGNRITEPHCCTALSFRQDGTVVFRLLSSSMRQQHSARPRLQAKREGPEIRQLYRGIQASKGIHVQVRLEVRLAWRNDRRIPRDQGPDELR